MKTSGQNSVKINTQTLLTLSRLLSKSRCSARIRTTDDMACFHSFLVPKWIAAKKTDDLFPNCQWPVLVTDRPFSLDTSQAALAEIQTDDFEVGLFRSPQTTPRPVRSLAYWSVSGSNVAASRLSDSECREWPLPNPLYSRTRPRAVVATSAKLPVRYPGIPRVSLLRSCRS